MRRALGPVLPLCLSLCLLLTGCSLLGGPEPDDAAQRLAAALTKRQVGTVDFAGTSGRKAQAALTDVLDRMSTVPAKVRAVDVTEDESDDDAASGVLVWTWRVAGKAWVTRSPLTLRKSGDTWQPVWDVRLVHPDLKDGFGLRATGLLPTRGDVLGAGGRRIVTDRAVVHYGIDKTRVPEAQAVADARALAGLLDIDAAAFAERVRKAGSRAYVDAITLRADDPRPSESAVAAIGSARATPAKVPLAPTRTFAAPILGRVGEPTADMVKKSGGTLSATDQVGIGGLEARYEETLHGTSGAKVSIFGPDGDGAELHRVEATPGEPLTTTLDVNLQRDAEDLLADVGPASALVAIRPSDGAIMAAASGPGSGALNTATFGRYAPGSTFKVVSSLALLRNGLTPQSEVECPATVTVDGKQFENYDDYPSGALGRISLETAIANSCNTAVIGQRDRLGASDLADAAAALGLGVDHDLGFPAYFGQVPTPASETEKAADLIGQGKVLASPMTMATVMASIGRGATVVPYLLPTAKPAASPPKPLTRSEAAQLKTLTGAVVSEGSGRLLADLPGGPTYAKTGTAEYGTDTPPRTHAWMVALHGDLAVAVFVADGDTGSGTAGPILRSFLERVG